MWPLSDYAAPSEGWTLARALTDREGVLEKDFYGKIYFYVKDVLTVFRWRLETLNMSFKFFQLDIKDLSGHLSEGTFARIEVSKELQHLVCKTDECIPRHRISAMPCMWGWLP